jgi:hypothetical protein
MATPPNLVPSVHGGSEKRVIPSDNPRKENPGILSPIIVTKESLTFAEQLKEIDRDLGLEPGEIKECGEMPAQPTPLTSFQTSQAGKTFMDTNSIGMRVNDDIGLSPRGPHSIGLKKVHGGSWRCITRHSMG